MRIGINALYLRPGEVGGTERYLRELLPALVAEEPENEWVLYLSGKAKGSFPDRPEQVRVVYTPAFTAERSVRSTTEQTWLPLRLERDRVDLVWHPGATVCVPSLLPQVTTIHDCQSKYFPEYFGRVERKAIEFYVRAAVRICAKLLAPSKSVRRDLVEHYGALSTRVAVTPEGVSKEFHPGDLTEAERRNFGELQPGEYLLCVASSLPHKNLPLLFRAYAQAAAVRPDLPVLAWSGSGSTRAVRKIAKEVGIESRLKILGWTPPQLVPALYRGARAVVLTSAFEGFGLAALEALASGAALLTTPTEPVVEVLDGAALVTGGFQQDELSNAIARIAFDRNLRKELRTKGPERASLYTWAECARLTLAAMRQAA
ncbi:MAG: glycosyltransferase family 4 protein [Chrysiogenetes bacterium]|nr:glycosyltransferase family 4 protein [Chrysiogenetes bacterium]